MQYNYVDCRLKKNCSKEVRRKSSCVCLPDTLADQFIVPLDEVHAEGGHFPAIQFVHKYSFKLNIRKCHLALYYFGYFNFTFCILCQYGKEKPLSCVKKGEGTQPSYLLSPPEPGSVTIWGAYA